MKKNLMFFCGISEDTIEFFISHLGNLKKYINIFDGYKICYLTKIKGSDELLNWAKSELNCFFDTLKIVDNDPINRETKYFIPMLEDISNKSDKNSITFYCHSKGSKLVTEKQPVLNWLRAMYYFNLDSIWLEDIMNHLKDDQYKCAGIFKDINDHVKLIPDADPRCKWWYQGTFFWFKQEEIFKINDWRNIYMSRWGTESYLGAYLDENDAYCIICNEQTPSLYSQPTWDIKFKKMVEVIKNNP